MHDRPLEVIMSTLRINRRFSLVGTLILSALSLGALAFPLSPATAQCLGVDLGFGCAGLGVGSWYSHPYYYGYPTYRGPTYYGYLAPAPGPVPTPVPAPAPAYTYAYSYPYSYPYQSRYYGYE